MEDIFLRMDRRIRDPIPRRHRSASSRQRRRVLPIPLTHFLFTKVEVEEEDNEDEEPEERGWRNCTREKNKNNHLVLQEHEHILSLAASGGAVSRAQDSGASFDRKVVVMDRQVPRKQPRGCPRKEGKKATETTKKPATEVEELAAATAAAEAAVPRRARNGRRGRKREAGGEQRRQCGRSPAPAVACRFVIPGPVPDLSRLGAVGVGNLAEFLRDVPEVD